jgi:hypothetical protein
MTLHKNVDYLLWRNISRDATKKKLLPLLEILSFATSHYVTSMQLIIVYNYLGHVYNYKFGIV